MGKRQGVKLSARERQRVSRALTDALGAIYDELHAAGNDEVKQHPVLRHHCRIYDRVLSARNMLDAK